MINDNDLLMTLINKEQLNKIKAKATEIKNRAIDQHINLAVTGLSRSGKTAFITSFVNQLVAENSQTSMSFFEVIQQGRFVAAKRVPQKALHIPRFDYETAIKALHADSPSWPEPTKGITQLRLAIKYQPDSTLRKFTSDTATLYVDLTDYPGEWLLDLPMLNQTFEEWSESMKELLESSPRKEASKAFLEAVNQLSPFDPVDEEKLAALSKQYTVLLHKFRQDLGLSLIQPGRFILPGELENAPILQFFPYTNFENLSFDAYQKTNDETLVGMLRARFLEYKERVVKSFYKKHFVNFDRQIILADCLSPLNKGADSFKDLQLALSLISKSFSYGKTNLLTRLLSPTIDKLMFAATKADHVTPEQHENLQSLVNQLVNPIKEQISFENIEMKTMSIASVKATKAGKSNYQGKSFSVIQGDRLDNQDQITLFPGEVPSELPREKYWLNNQFNFVAFAPCEHPSENKALPQIRMDQVLEFLLGDKLQ